MIIFLKQWFLFFVASGLLMLCYAVLALLALYSGWLKKKKKKGFFSFSEKNVGGIIFRLLS